MLYHLFNYLDKHYDLAGAGLFQYITFRAMLTTIFSVLFIAFFGKRIIHFLQKMQMGEIVRNLGLAGQMEKTGTPTMGGVIIIGAIVFPVLLFANLQNVYIQLLLTTLLWTGAIGFIDDYLKRVKKNKDGLSGKFKILGQVGLGLLVGLTLVSNEDVMVRKFSKGIKSKPVSELVKGQDYEDIRSLETTIPFLKDNEINYSEILPNQTASNVLYIILVIFIITAVSNGTNITDGLDGLAAGTSAIVATVLAIFAYLSGNIIFSNYLNIMYIPQSGEIAIFATALVGACIGFLWYNAYPAQVFMGDTGSLALGGVIASLAIVLRKELMLPLLCGVFLVENLSVMIQVFYFKYTKKKYGEGRRVFLMAPLHHHYQKKEIPEPKIVTRFWIVSILLAISTILTLKIR
ncbi:phospho-N-acetylmuramoyl-pentapeptide-transferase [Flammeovirga yaeyamensis]|uniref:Phospho-N-acetylmuramoyl-pentapeptide-transferase n=1 Tax=Flammeovirga yaeyamensis TaxID=367791 RepID=A0AAX1N823_9BACT|nr:MULTISPECIES: phospho-N-acetylmuramoyl-pentapeptide-transferase [Flammeovirga]ANQ49153.1 phospho-N-acetylmuramoyl-pentapeptide-transferase [Flammeovirga sp. MY04]MBB3697984.1 phospho-N-acetylmuramoyl-pentapeptide-transferase [Flammeovirga yaeyamensis]NMF35664.1 phospho-N-acetylmuramoyl-pentapeptide-transferase [Flammeovirga yaeyamensis]QWG03381.1 phospho-N-acetylmuramoyl-pentapeptide-transferase [Flammeovirga yaeyamensis]